MASFCLMCGRDIADGYLCDKCDRPKTAKKQSKAAKDPETPVTADPAPTPPAAEPTAAKPAVPPPAPPPQPKPQPHQQPQAASSHSGQPSSAAQVAYEPFPKAPVVQFPLESTSLGVTTVCEILAAAAIPSVVIGADRSIRFVSDEGRKLLGAGDVDQLTLRTIESQLGITISLAETTSQVVHVAGRPVRYSMVPLTGSGGGGVILLRPQEPMSDQSPFASYVRETVLAPLRALHDSLSAAARTRVTDPLLQDSASTIDQILSSLELASTVEEPAPNTVQPQAPSIIRIVHQVADQFRASARKKTLTLQVDVATDLDSPFRDYQRLITALQILVENALFYAPPSGQIVIGARQMEFKDKPVLLFFVMDNGPVVPEEYKKSIFDPGFVWDANDSLRSGKGLARVRQFAIDHGGQVSVESKSGKTCTFLLRIRPDNG